MSEFQTAGGVERSLDAPVLLARPVMLGGEGIVEAAPTQPPSPIEPNERIDLVDAIRGVALLGILLVNMAFFRGPLVDFNPQVELWLGETDQRATFLIHLLAEGKFYTMFSLLFGFGLAIQIIRAEARGSAWRWRYARRMFVLMGFGVAHIVCLWYGDILLIYAITGFLLLALARVSTRWLAVIAVGMLLFSALLMSGIGAISTAESAAGQAAEIQKFLGEEIMAYASGSLADIVSMRLTEYAYLSIMLILTGPSILAMFLLGLLAGRHGLFARPEAYGRLWIRMIALGVLVGLPFSVLATATRDPLVAGRDALLEAESYAAMMISAPLMSMAYVSGLVLLWRTGVGRVILSRLAPVGRMALTNYLSHSLICALIFHSYGLGLFGGIGPADGCVLVLAIYLAQIAISNLWLGIARFGPMEWIWRTLTYGKIQPIFARA